VIFTCRSNGVQDNPPQCKCISFGCSAGTLDSRIKEAVQCDIVGAKAVKVCLEERCSVQSGITTEAAKWECEGCAACHPDMCSLISNGCLVGG
jgi:hypothetical protein